MWNRRKLPTLSGRKVVWVHFVFGIAMVLFVAFGNAEAEPSSLMAAAWPTVRPVSTPAPMPTPIPMPALPFKPDVGNLVNGGQVTTDGEFFYAVELVGRKYEIICFDRSLNRRYTLSTTNSSFLHYYDGFVYFVRDSSDAKIHHRLFRIAATAGEPEQVSSDKVFCYYVDETGLYYALEGRSGIYRSDYDGSNPQVIANAQVNHQNGVSRLAVYDDKLYFIDNKDMRVYRVSLEGGEIEPVTQSGARSFTFAEVENIPHLLYIDSIRGSERLYALSLVDGRLEDFRLSCRYYNYLDGWLYYGDNAQNGALYRMDMRDPSRPRQHLANIKSVRIYVFQNWIFASDDSKAIYAFHPDGSDRRKLTVLK